MAWASTREGTPSRAALPTRAARTAAPPCSLAAPEGRLTPGDWPAASRAAKRVMAKARRAIGRYRLPRRLPRDRSRGQPWGGDPAGKTDPSTGTAGHPWGLKDACQGPRGPWRVEPGWVRGSRPRSGGGPAAVAALAGLHHAHHRAHHHRQGIVVLVTALELGVENPLSRAGRTTAGTAAGGGTQLVGGQGIQGSSTGNPWILANEVLKRWPQGKSLMRRQAGRPQPGDGGQPGASG